MAGPVIPKPDLGSPVANDVANAAIQQFGLDPSLVNDFLVSENVPRTRTRTTHGLTIRVAGVIIGAVNAVDHTQTRTLDDEWEVDRSGVGHAPADIVPQIVTGRTLRVGRYDLFVRNIEEVFNRTGELVTLADQYKPFTLRTVWQSPVGIVLGGRRVYEYAGCWFSSIGRNVSSTGDRIVNVDAEITYQIRRRVA